MKLVHESAKSLGIKPKVLEESDPRAKWSTSVNAAIWMGTGSTPAERNAKFLRILSLLRRHSYPAEGTSIVATYPNPDDPLFTRIIIKVRPVKDELNINLTRMVLHQMGSSPWQPTEGPCTTPAGS